VFAQVLLFEGVVSLRTMRHLKLDTALSPPSLAVSPEAGVKIEKIMAAAAKLPGMLTEKVARELHRAEGLAGILLEDWAEAKEKEEEVSGSLTMLAGLADDDQPATAAVAMAAVVRSTRYEQGTRVFEEASFHALHALHVSHVMNPSETTSICGR
jgi:hypothetical protein